MLLEDLMDVVGQIVPASASPFDEGSLLFGPEFDVDGHRGPRLLEMPLRP